MIIHPAGAKIMFVQAGETYWLRMYEPPAYNLVLCSEINYMDGFIEFQYLHVAQTAKPAIVRVPFGNDKIVQDIVHVERPVPE